MPLDRLGRAPQLERWGGAAPLRSRCLLLLALATACGAAACGDPCADLQFVCDTCQDPNKKAACERSVDEDPDDVCQQNIDSYDSICN